jgi:septal ring factor EnvC (AmiA/AmiB activator)
MWETAPMGLEQLIHQVEANLLHLGRRLAGDAREERVAECQRLLAEIARVEAGLEAQQQRLFALQRRVKEHEDEIASLPAQVEDSHRRGKAARALWQALLLDRRRQELAADRAELPRVEHLCWSLGFRLRLLRRQLDEVRAELRRG